MNSENEFLAINVLKTEQNKEFFVKFILQRRIIGTILYLFPYIFIRFVLRMNHHEPCVATDLLDTCKDWDNLAKHLPHDRFITVKKLEFSVLTHKKRGTS